MISPRIAGVGAVLAVAFVACGGSKPAESPGRVRATDGSCPTLPWPATPLAVGPSELVAHVELPFARVRAELETKVAKRLAEEKDRDIGSAGRLQYTVDRGAFELSVKGDAVLVEAPIVANAQACTSRGGCYAGCAPEGRFQVAVRLGADYRLHADDARVTVTKKCEVKVAGGLVRLDVTPTLRSEIAKRMPAIEKRIDRELPDFKKDATRAWNELSQPRSVPFGKCLVTAPEGIAQGPLSPIADGARFRFAILARPELRIGCEGAPPPIPLPPLQSDPKMGPAGDAHLAVVEPASLACPSEPPPPGALAAALPSLAQNASNERADVSAAIESATAGGQGTRGNDRVSVVDVRGAVTIRAK